MKMPLDSNNFREIVVSAPDSEYLFVSMQNLESEKSVITAVNNLLANGKTRLKGLQLLKDLILHCSHEVFVENALQWASHCTVHHVEDGSKEIKLNTLAKIIENSGEIDAFNKKFSSEYLSTTLKACLVTHNNDEKLSCLKCLSQCMKRYPTWFGNHKQKIEAFLIETLDSSCEVAEIAATAFVYFLQTGGAGVNGINHVNNFESQFRKICATIQILYDMFLEGVSEINNTMKIDGESFKFKELSDSNKIFEVTGTRILNCLVFLETMLAKQYTVEKRIVPKFVVDIICRGLSVHLCFTKEIITEEDIKKSILLRNIQMRLLKLLRIFTMGFQPNLLPFAYELKKSLANTAKRNCNCFIESSFKTQFYKTLQIWLMMSKNVNETYLEEAVVTMAIKDISPVRKNVLLNLDVSKTKSKEVKNKQVLANRGNDCISALETLKCLLKGSCLTYNQTLLQEIVFTLVRIVGDLQISKVVLPYVDPKCQVKLYEVLIAIFSQENVSSLPSLHSLVMIFTNGAKSSNHGIWQMSMEGLDLLEKISQPVCASLYVSESKSDQQVGSSDLLSLEMDVEVEDNNVDSKVSPENHESDTEKKIHIISDIVISQPKVVQEMEVVENNSVVEEVANSVSSSNDLVMEEKPKKISIEVKDDNDDNLEDMFHSFHDVVQE
ncbi:uncharacterized protein LOC123015908 [Tribolium madens]|uniref:uncharacterized protein LOC123015908 n=1 Tax=Tribolium madens TaxID=41895 RepID=UPI001CF71FC1|nr:uncharacterized protein LOC123015908 [Tribolium madens]